MMKMIIFAALMVATADAVVPKSLRFKASEGSLHTARADPAEGELKPGDLKTLSTAMKCVMSLIFLYLLVTVIMKVIAFKAQMMTLYNKMQSDMAFLPDVPEVPTIPNPLDKKEEAKEGEEAEKKEGEEAPLNPQDQAKAAAAAAAERSRAALAGTMSWVTNMFSMEKLSTIQNAMGLVPMFCILIVFTRLRAKVDLQTEPQEYAKTWMIVSTACLFLQILTCLLPQFPEEMDENGKPKPGISFGKIWAYITIGLDITGTVGVYGGIGVICYSIFNLKFQNDKLVAGGAAPIVTPSQ